MGQARATLLLTRPKARSEHFASLVKPWAQGLDIVISPLMDIVALHATDPAPDAAGMIFTSRNGVAHWKDGDGRPAFCVGESTAEAARQKGWDAVVSGPTAEDLIASLTETPPPGPLLHVGGVHKRGDIAGRLTAAGLPTEEVTVYDQKLLPLSSDAVTALNGGNSVIVPLFSPRTARQFAKQAKGIAPIHLLVMSDAVMKEVETLKTVSKTAVAAPDQAAMLEALRKLLRRVEARGAPQ